MARKLKLANMQKVLDVREAIHHLKRARDLMKGAECDRTVERIRSALKSAGGAERHVNRRHDKFIEEGP